MNTLHAGTLILEPQTVAHAEVMFRVLSDPAIYEFENEPPRSVGWLRDRYRRLETRRSPEGDEHWLNWVIRLPDGELAGYVQASVQVDGHADIAYVLSSENWGRSFARRSVEVMIRELAQAYGVHTLWAVFKTPNFRSRRLLERLSFGIATGELSASRDIEPDETLMTRSAGCGAAEDRTTTPAPNC